MPTTELLPITRTLSIMLTHKCTAQCDNCGTMSGPKVSGRADLETVFAAIDQARELGFANVVFTGGEPTIYFEDLLASISRARDQGLLTRVVSNGGWCRGTKRAAEKMERLLDAGLDEINFSAGDEHQRFIPLECVITGIVCALDHGLPVHLMIEKTKKSGITKATVLATEPLASHPLADRLGVNESPWMPLSPFATNQYEAGKTANRDNIHSFPGCDSILQTYVVHPGKEVTTCCGIGSRIIPELKAEEDFEPRKKTSLFGIIAEAEEDLMKIWLRQDGPEKILKWAADHDPSIKWENMYAHRCQACARIYKDKAVRKAIVDHYEEIIADVLTKTYLFDGIKEDA